MADVDVNNNSSRNILVVLVVLALILLVIILLVSGGKDNTTGTTPGDNTASTSDTDNATMLINAKHQYNAETGEHIVAGEIEMPTPCDILSTDTTVDSDADPDQVTLIFTTNNSGEECAQTITTERFKETFKADENAKISATFNGQPVQLNLVPADPGEDLNDFQIYLKG